MSSWARVGVKCVCIKRDPWVCELGVPAKFAPAYGEECEIEGVHPDGDKTYLTLRGYSFLAQWNAAQFRPLVPPKTQAQDVALFKSLLTPASELVE